MISKEIVKYSFENLKKRKSRSLLTIISILVGIATIFIFISFGLGLYGYINGFVTGTAANKIIIEPKGSVGGLDTAFALTSKDLTAVERTPGVYEATGLYKQVSQVEYKNSLKYVPIVGYDPSNPILTQTDGATIYEGRELQKGEKGDVVLGYDFSADNSIFKKGVSINDELEVNGQKVKVVGFYNSLGNSGDDSLIYVTEDFFKDIYPNTTGYNEIVASANPTNISQVVQNVDKSLLISRNLKKGQEDFFAQSAQDLINSFSSALNIVIGFIILIALISVLVSAINTSNTMITSVIERRKEIGVLKSIGARNSEILNLFLFESSTLGFIAGTLGVIFGFILTQIAKVILIKVGLGFLQPSYSIWLFVGCILFATLTGAVSGVVPAINASRISPVKALRYE
ncbi:MAG: FtsX-like permease family protein [Candidatus Nanoarchaeia archaeon]